MTKIKSPNNREIDDLISILSQQKSKPDIKSYCRIFTAIFCDIQAKYRTEYDFPYSINTAKFLLEKCDVILQSNYIKEQPLLVKEYFLCARKALIDAIQAGMISFTSYKNLEIASAAIIGMQETYPTANFLYPKIVHLETQAICNASCTFCDYSSLKRKGLKMSDEMINKILLDLREIPETHSFQVQPYKISEPFLDPRLTSIVERILMSHKNSETVIITNGNHLPKRTLNELDEIAKKYKRVSPNSSKIKTRIRITVSLNEINSQKYSQLMNLSFEKTINNLKMLHQKTSENLFSININLSRVSTDAEGDREFIVFCKEEFPLFNCSLIKMNNWTSTNSFSSEHDALKNEPINSYSKMNCNRWSDLSIMANGQIALCCMDSGEAEIKIGSVQDNNCLDLYRAKNKRFIPKSFTRGDALYPCSGCTYHQGGSLHKAFSILKDRAMKVVAKNEKYPHT